MSDFGSQAPGSELTIRNWLWHKKYYRSYGQWDWDKEHPMVAKHHWGDDECGQRHGKAEGVEKSTPSQQALLQARVERSHSEWGRAQVPDQQKVKEDRICNRFVKYFHWSKTKFVLDDNKRATLV